MNKQELMAKASTAVAKGELTIKRYSPEILMVVGIAAGIGATVLACKKTLKAKEIMDESKETLQKIDVVLNDPAYESVNYTEEDAEQDRKTAMAQSTISIMKTYAPVVGLSVLSITCILASNHILKERNVAISAAYAALSTDFKNYRSRVIEKYGKEIDEELRHGVKKKLICEEVTDPETGEVKKEEKEVEVVDGRSISQYARIFDEGAEFWTPSADHNKAFLIMEQNYANERLMNRGYLFLNEVYERLGFRPTRAGSVVGWIYKGPGSERVDFGIFTAHTQKAEDFLNGLEPSIILDFNVQGDILTPVTEGDIASLI